MATCPFHDEYRKPAPLQHEDRKPAPLQYLPFIVSPLLNEPAPTEIRRNTTDSKCRPDCPSSRPIFRRRVEPATIELLYDLFFVANLNTFTSIREVTDLETMSAYLGFFCILWFVWLQVTFYDVRFIMDSIFDRVCKVCHFGVMMGIAISGPTFLPDHASADAPQMQVNLYTLRRLSLILMCSGIILLFQYGMVVWFVRRYNRIVLPLSFTMLTIGAGVVTFLGLYFGFANGESLPYIGWYVVLVLEAVGTLYIAGRWASLGFVHTHLASRVGLLTLIILGEGVIGITRAIKDVIYGAQQVNPSIIGQIIAAVLILYCLYLMYFDRVQVDRLGVFRQEVWLLAHLPFHIGLVLLFEGVKNFIKWWSFIATLSRVESIGRLDTLNRSRGPWAIWGPALNTTILELVAQYRHNKATSDSIKSDAQQVVMNQSLLTLSQQTSNATWNQTEVDATVNNLLTSLNLFILEQFSFPTPDNVNSAQDPTTQLSLSVSPILIAFVYSFTAAGVALIFLAVLMLVGTKTKKPGDYLIIGLRAVLGVALALVALIILSSNRSSDYLGGPWILATITFTLALVPVVDNFLLYFVPRLFSSPTSPSQPHQSPERPSPIPSRRVSVSEKTPDLPAARADSGRGSQDEQDGQDLGDVPVRPEQESAQPRNLSVSIDNRASQVASRFSVSSDSDEVSTRMVSMSSAVAPQAVLGRFGARHSL